MDNIESEEYCSSTDPHSSVKKMETIDDTHLKKYIMWENKSNICWLDASMALVAHNKVMKKYTRKFPGSRVSRIISAYQEAISIINNSINQNINQKLNVAREILNRVQESTLQYLQPILKYKTGDPESAFCSLYNLLIQNSDVKNTFDVTWISVKECTNCGHHSESRKSKPVITLSKIDSFDPENPAVLYNCSCNRSSQKIKLVYVSLPPCLIFHFENGAGKEKPPLNFNTQGRKYHLTCIMTLEKSQDSNVNHFITWIRNPFVDKWLDCNDLNMDITSFSPGFPDINLQDIYMCVYESFDKLGTITDSKVGNIKKSDENILCIDLSEEFDLENSNSQNNAPESNKDIGKMAISLSNSRLQDKVSDVDKLPEVHKYSLDSKITQSNVIWNIKTICDQTSCVENLGNQSESLKVNNDKISRENNETSLGVRNIDNSSKFKAVLGVATPNNMTTADSFDGKQISENSKYDCIEANNLKSYKINKQNSISSCTARQILEGEKIPSIIEDKSKETELKYKLSQLDSTIVESKPSFDNEEEQNFRPNVACLAENIQNKSPLSKSCFATPNILDEKTTNPGNLDSAKTGGFILAKCCTKKKDLEEDLNNSEQFVFNSHVEENNDEKLVPNSELEQQIHSKQFLSSAAAISSGTGTSYVKLSLRRKKSNSSLHKKNYMNEANISNSEESFNKDVIASSFSKPLKETRKSKREMEKDCDYFPSGVPKKKPRMENVSNVKKDSINIKAESHNSHLKTNVKVLKTGLKKSLQVKSTCKKRMHDRNSSLNVINEERNPEEHQQLSSEQCYSSAGKVSEADNSGINSDDKGKILKEFADVWSCHKRGCSCEFAGLEEIIDTTVDFTFAYLCKLGKELKNSNSH